MERTPKRRSRARASKGQPLAHGPGQPPASGPGQPTRLRTPAFWPDTAPVDPGHPGDVRRIDLQPGAAEEFRDVGHVVGQPEDLSVHTHTSTARGRRRMHGHAYRSGHAFRIIRVVLPRMPARHRGRRHGSARWSGNICMARIQARVRFSGPAPGPSAPRPLGRSLTGSLPYRISAPRRIPATPDLLPQPPLSPPGGPSNGTHDRMAERHPRCGQDHDQRAREATDPGFTGVRRREGRRDTPAARW